VRLAKLAVGLVLGFSVLTTSAAQALNCVQFVRATTDFDLAGNAWQWWEHAAGFYQRGPEPHTRSVLVFKQTQHMRAGHVAIVSRVLDQHTILLDHANWGYGRGPKGQVDRGISAIDCSERGDWSAVCVYNKKFGVYGAPYPTYGFIYPREFVAGVPLR
jgi:surface antigen